MSDNDGCDGCLIYPTIDICFYSSVEGCPCKTCIVKMMCGKPCSDLIAHVKIRYNTMNVKTKVGG